VQVLAGPNLLAFLNVLYLTAMPVDEQIKADKLDFMTQEAAACGVFLFSAGLVLMLDQISKALALGSVLGPRRSGSATRLPRVRVGLNCSAGIALFSFRYAFVLWSIALLGTMFLIHCVSALQGWGVQMGFGIALGGATGNLLDLARRGAVVDFIDIRIWPVFNLADACIVLGAGGVLWSIA